MIPTELIRSIVDRWTARRAAARRWHLDYELDRRQWRTSPHYRDR